MVYPNPSNYLPDITGEEQGIRTKIADALAKLSADTIAAVPPSPVVSAGCVQLKDFMPTGSNPNFKHLVHLMPWFRAGSSHTANTACPYDMTDPKFIARMCNAVKKLGAWGFLIDAYGPTKYDDVFKLVLAECANQHLEVGAIVDKGAVNASGDPTQNFIAYVKYILATYATQPGFFHDFIGDFDGIKKNAAGVPLVDFAKVRAAYPAVRFVHNIAGDGEYFAWDASKDPVQRASHYSDPNCIMAGIGGWFNDDFTTGLKPDGRGNWSSPTVPKDVRYFNPCMFPDPLYKSLDLIPARMLYGQWDTLNDHEELSALAALFFFASGTRPY